VHPPLHQPSTDWAGDRALNSTPVFDEVMDLVYNCH
jgi:hypothetical protein